MKRIIRLEVKCKDCCKKNKKELTWNEFFDKMKDYAASKYGVVLSKSDDFIFVRDLISCAAYKTNLFKDWFESYKNGDKKRYKEELDLLLYMQLLQMFMNLFGNDEKDTKYYS